MSSANVETLPRTARRAPRPRPWAVDLLGAASGLGLGATIALGIAAETSGSLSASGGLLTFAGRLTGLVGAYAMLIAVLLAARIPALEPRSGRTDLSGCTAGWHPGRSV